MIVFTPYLSTTVVLAKSPRLGLVALKLLASLISHIIACSGRIVVDKEMQRTTTLTLAAHARQGLMIH